MTRRCFERRFLLVPRGQVPAIFGYCLAVAFPYGTLQLVQEHGARCRPPPSALRAAA